MRNLISSLVVLTTVNYSVLPAAAGESGWTFKQLTNAQGKQNVVVTARAISICHPKQRYRIYSAAPHWRVTYINDQTGRYIEFPHERFIGSIMGRIGDQLGNDVQMLHLTNPRLVNEKGLEYATYAHRVKITRQDIPKFKTNPSLNYQLQGYEAKYLREPGITNQEKELLCKISCVPMLNHVPISFLCTDWFRQQHELLLTVDMHKEKNLTIAPPDLKNLKLVKTEAELFSSKGVADVFELFGDLPSQGDKKKPGNH